MVATANQRRTTCTRILCAANTHQEQLLIPEILFIKGGTGVSVNSSAKQSLVVVIKGSIKGSALIQLVESEQ